MQDDHPAAGAIIILAFITLTVIIASYPGVLPEKAGENGISPAVPATPATWAPAAGTPVVRHEASPPHNSYWTELDPVPDIRYGSTGNLTVCGTTNVPAGEILRVEFIAHSLHPSPMEYYPDLSFHASTNVRKGEPGVSRWSLEVPLQNFMNPDTFQILVVNQSGYSIGGSSVNVTPA
jgi:hypothetical protein